MSGEKSEPTNQHMFECIQREGESNRDWIKRHLRGVHAYRRKMETEWTPTPQQPQKPKAAPTTVSSGHQPDDRNSADGLVATVRQGHAKHSTHDERDYTPPASPQKGSPENMTLTSSRRELGTTQLEENELHFHRRQTEQNLVTTGKTN